MAQFDLALPKFGAGDLDDEKQRRKIMNYLVKLDEQLRFVLNNLDTENFTETFQQVIVSGGGGGSGESSESLKALEEEINRLSTKVTQTANEIALKASAEELNELGDLVKSLNAEFKVLADEISLKVSREEYNSLKSTVDRHSTSITQTAEEIALKADKTVVDALSGEVTKNTAQLQVTAEQIQSTVEQVNTLGNTVSVQGTQITQTAEKIESTAKSVETLGGRVSEAESTISQQAGKITANTQAIQTAQSTADGAASDAQAVAKRVTTAEASISALDGKIATKVERTEFNALNQTVSANRSEFTQTANNISQRVTDEVAGLQAQIDVNAEGILIQAGRTVGGTNYLLNSKGPYVATGTGSERYLFPWPCSSQEEATSLYGKTVTVSFDYETAITSGSFRLSTYDTWQLVEEFDSYGRSGHVAKTIQVANATARDANFLYIRGTWTGSVTFSNVKVETGDYATDWSPHPNDPASSVDAGGVVRVDQTGVHMSGGTIEMETSDGNEYIHIRSDGISASSLAAPDVAPRYDGPSVLYVNPNATGAQIAAGNYFRSLADALAKLNRRWVGYDVTINLAAGMTEYGTPGLAGVSGGGQIVINGNGAKLVGGMSLYYGSARVMVNNLKVDMTGGTGITADGWIKPVLQGCVITGRGSGYGVYSTNNAGVTVNGCEIYDCERSLYGIAGGEIDGYACKGNCRVGANRSTLYLHDSMPCDSTTWAAGTWAGQVLTANISVDQGSKPTVEPEPVTAYYSYTGSDSYAGAWGKPDTDISQGFIRTDNAGNTAVIYGTIWFDAAAIKSALSGKTIKQASIRLHMLKYVDGKPIGRGDTVSVQLYGTNKAYDGRSGAPGLTTSYGTIGTTEPGEVSEITIPAAAISDMVSGKIVGLVLKSDDTELYKDRDYSRNYARFAGSRTATTDTCPRLTVVCG